MPNENEDEVALVPVSRDEALALVPQTVDAFLAPTTDQSAPAERGGLAVPYIGFRGIKATKNVEALNAAGITVGRDGSGVFYLMDPPTPIKLDPVKFHLIQYLRAYTTQDDNGNVTDAIFESDDTAFEAGFREAIFGTVVVVLPGDKPAFAAATLQLRSAQTNALRDSIRLLEGVMSLQGEKLTDALAARGKAWEASGKVRVPGGRFITTIWSTAETPKGGGQKFNQGHGQVFPITAAHADAFNEWLAGDGFPALQKAAAVTNVRFEKVRRIAKARNNAVRN